jgi:Fe-S oxidoreductase
MHPVQTGLFWLFVAGSIALFANTANRRIGALVAGLPDDRFDRPWERLKGLFLYAFVQKRMVRDWYAGLFHLLIFWGFCVLAVRSVGLIAEGLFPSFHLTETLGVWGLGYQLTKDVFEVLVILGIGMAMFRRLFLRPARLDNSWDAWATLSLIGGLMVTDLIADGAYIILNHPDWATWSPAGSAVAGLLAGMAPSGLQALYTAMWWLHLAILFGFLNFLPYSKHFHVLTALFNVYFRELEPNKNIKKMDLEVEHFGANRIQDFTWKQLLDLYTCTECGRCKEVCPTTLTGKPLRPKNFGNDLRDYLYATPADQMKQDKPVPEDRLLIGSEVPEGAKWELSDDEPPWTQKELGGAVSKDTIWACTTCGYCEWACPLFITFVDKIVQVRRYLTLEESDFPAEAQVGFKGMERQGNPWNLPQADRGKWADGLDIPVMAEEPEVEYLFWVGCAGAYDAAGQKVSKALAKLLTAAGVKFAILAEEETCTGDSARRLGNEYLFQTLAEANVETLNGYKVKKIVTNCPHCLNTLKNEYPAFGGKFEVVHGTDLVAQLVAQGKLRLTQEVKEHLTYHDPCYLARYNGVVDQPRQLLKAIPGVQLTEIKQHGEAAMCCGAGGGRMWLEEKLGTRVNHLRLEQALETKASGVAVACPFCNVMLNNAAGETGHEGFQTMDVLELAARSAHV